MRLGNQLSIFRPDKDEKVVVVNNYTSFHELMQEKEEVIDEFVRDRANKFMMESYSSILNVYTILKVII